MVACLVAQPGVVVADNIIARSATQAAVVVAGHIATRCCTKSRVAIAFCIPPGPHTDAGVGIADNALTGQLPHRHVYIAIRITAGAVTDRNIVAVALAAVDVVVGKTAAGFNLITCARTQSDILADIFAQIIARARADGHVIGALVSLTGIRAHGHIIAAGGSAAFAGIHADGHAVGAISIGISADSDGIGNACCAGGGGAITHGNRAGHLCIGVETDGNAAGC